MRLSITQFHWYGVVCLLIDALTNSYTTWRAIEHVQIVSIVADVGSTQ